VVAVISLGLTLLVAGETQFNMVGFVLVMLASMLSGLRWTITQVLLQGSDHQGKLADGFWACGVESAFHDVGHPWWAVLGQWCSLPLLHFPANTVKGRPLWKGSSVVRFQYFHKWLSGCATHIMGFVDSAHLFLALLPACQLSVPLGVFQ
jgi:hypothetical protein